MLNSTKLKIIAILLMVCIIFWSKTPQNTFGIQTVLLPLPTLKHCSCDSATYCLNDEDVIHLHMWYENAKFFVRYKH